MAVYPTVPLMMFGWIPFVLQLFKRLRPHHAVIAGFLLAWMFLPQYDYELPALPNYSKISAASYGILLGSFLFNRQVFSRFRFHCPRPAGGAVVPVLLHLLDLTNGLGVWDGLSAFLGKVTVVGHPVLHRPALLRPHGGAARPVPGHLPGRVDLRAVLSVRDGDEPAPAQAGVRLAPGTSSDRRKRGGGWRPVVFMEARADECHVDGQRRPGRPAPVGQQNLGKRLPVLPAAQPASPWRSC
jgi:hypothetical protein